MNRESAALQNNRTHFPEHDFLHKNTLPLTLMCCFRIFKKDNKRQEVWLGLFELNNIYKDYLRLNNFPNNPLKPF